MARTEALVMLELTPTPWVDFPVFTSKRCMYAAALELEPA